MAEVTPHIARGRWMLLGLLVVAVLGTVALGAVVAPHAVHALAG